MIKQHKILIVDDELGVLESWEYLLRRNYHVLLAASGEEALIY